jgi:hypothetical protein
MDQLLTILRNKCHPNVQRFNEPSLGIKAVAHYFQVLSLLANNTNRVRSRQVNAGRFTCRLSTISCWRRSMFSSTSSCLPSVRSTAALKITPSLSGFVY